MIGVRIPQTQDPEKKGATQIDEMTLQDSREIYYGSEFRNKNSSLDQGEGEEVAGRTQRQFIGISKRWISTIR